MIIETLFELFFISLMNFLFFPRKIPKHYYQEIVFNYKKNVFLSADLVNDKKKLNITNITKKKFKSFLGKENYPIIFIGPFSNINSDNIYQNLQIGLLGKK